MLFGISSAFGQKLTLPEYVKLLKHNSSDEIETNGLRGAPEYDYVFDVRYPIDLTSMDISFYGNANCTSLQATVNLSQAVTLPIGTYSSSDASNYAMCSSLIVRGDKGSPCYFAFSAASAKFVYNTARGQVLGDCWATNLQDGSGFTCGNGASCGFSVAHTDIYDPVVND